MKDEAASRVIDALIPFLIAMGISLPVDAFFGGLFLAIAAALAVRYFMPERDRREIVWTIIVAVLAAIVAAGLGHMWMPEVVVQFKMMIAGAASRFVVALFVRAGMTAEERSGGIADFVIDRVLPDDKKDGEK